MVVLRCTQKLLARLKRPAVVPSGMSSTRLGDWYGNALRLGRQQLLLFVSGRTRLAVNIHARDARRLPTVLADAVADRLAALGVPAALIEQERQHMADVVFARTDDRSVVGTMNDYVFMARGIHARALEHPGEMWFSPAEPLVSVWSAVHSSQEIASTLRWIEYVDAHEFTINGEAWRYEPGEGLTRVKDDASGTGQG